MRRGRIVVSKAMLRLLLDLPRHLIITSVYETPSDSNRDAFSIGVRGRFCPEVAEGDPDPSITPVYSDIGVGKAHLIGLNGLDT